MVEIISRCGYRCDMCLIYRDNLKGERDMRRFRDGLLKYYGDRLTLEECYCDGCMTPDSENPILITFDCRVRPCVMARGLENCADCDEYPCKDLEKRSVDYERVKERHGGPLPEADYETFVKPYESRQRLDEIRRRRST